MIADPGSVYYAIGRITKNVNSLSVGMTWNTGNNGRTPTDWAAAIMGDSYHANMIHIDGIRSGYTVALFQNSALAKIVLSVAYANEGVPDMAADGTLYTLNLSVSGDTLTIVLNGITKTVTDPLIGLLDKQFFLIEAVVPDSASDNVEYRSLTVGG